MRFLICVFLAASAMAKDNELALVEVFVPPLLDTHLTQALLRAQITVAAIYSPLGVKVKWRLAQSESPGCLREPMHAKILVAFADNPPAALSRLAFAFSKTSYYNSGPCMTIFLDRLRPMAAKNPIGTGAILGHVFAHEMGHILQNAARHSDIGLLQGSWSMAQLERMRGETLRFTPFDVLMIWRNFRPEEPAPSAAISVSTPEQNPSVRESSSPR